MKRVPWELSTQAGRGGGQTAASAKEGVEVGGQGKK